MTVTNRRTKTAVPERVADETLEENFQGELIRPSNPAYEEARKVWNGMIDRHPALVARCSGVSDVKAAVRFALRSLGLGCFQ